MTKGDRLGLTIVAIFLALLALLCLGAATPNIDGPYFEAAQRRPFGIAFAVLATLAIVCWHLPRNISIRRIFAEAAFNFVVFLFIGLLFNL